MIVEIPVKVSFLKHTLTCKNPGIVEGDYNTTKLVFTFEEGIDATKVLFKLSSPQQEILLLNYLDESSSVVLTSYDEDGNPCSLFGAAGLYPFELVWYGDNGKLTSPTCWLSVSKRQVTVVDSLVNQYLPFFDKLSKINHSVFIRFSAHPDGTDFTEAWNEGQTYFGVATAQHAPTEKEGYTWVMLGRGEKGDKGDTSDVGSIETVNGQTLNFFIGTKAEYEALPEDVKLENLFSIITDEDRETVIASLESIMEDIDGIKSGDIVVGKAEEANSLSTPTYTVEVPATWTSESGYWYQEVAVEGIKATDEPIVDVVLGNDTVDQDKQQLAAWGCVSRISTGDGKIVLYAYEDEPTVAFTIKLREVS